MIKINLKRNEIIRDDIFEDDNLTRTVEFDFTDCDVDSWEKFLDVKDSEGNIFKIELGTDTIIPYNITNLITRKGELKLNPVAVQEDKDGQVMRKGFKTFVMNVQETINSYGFGTQEHGDVIIPLRNSIIELENKHDKEFHEVNELIDVERDRINKLLVVTDSIKDNATQLEELITNNDNSIVALTNEFQENVLRVDKELDSVQQKLGTHDSKIGNLNQLIVESVQELDKKLETYQDKTTLELEDHATRLRVIEMGGGGSGEVSAELLEIIDKLVEDMTTVTGSIDAINSNMDAQGKEIRTIQGAVLDLNNTVLSHKDYVIESGSNEHGYWEKWKSGKLVQWGSVEITFDIDRPWGSLFYGGNQSYHPFPISFIDEPIFKHSLDSRGGTSFIPANYYRTVAERTNFTGFSGVRPDSAKNAIGVISWIAIGKWK